MTQGAASLGTLWTDRCLTVRVRDESGFDKAFEVGRPFARIGSLPGAEVQLPAEHVPRRGLYLHATDEGVYCLNLKPTLRGQPSANGWLRPANFVPLGPYRITCSFADDGPQDEVELADLRARDSAGEDAPALVIDSSAGGQSEFRQVLSRKLTLVGRRLPARLRLDHPSMSSSHCVLYWDRGILWVVDLLSAEGTHVDGQRIDVGELRPGQTLLLGKLPLARATSDKLIADGGAQTTDKHFSSRQITNDIALERLLKHLDQMGRPEVEDD